MAGLNLALCVWTASLIACASGIYYDCSISSLEMCAGNLEQIKDETNLDILCPPLQAAKSCLTNMEVSCKDDTQGVKEQVQSTLEMVNPALDPCPDDAVGPAVAMFGTMGHGSTQDDIWQQSTTYSPGNNYEPCLIYTAQSCSDEVNALPPYATTHDKCQAWKGAMTCYQAISNMCHEAEVQTFVMNAIDRLEYNMDDMCEDMTTARYMTSSPDPSAEPHGTCSWMTAKQCSSGLDHVQDHHSKDEKCYAWNEVMACFGNIQYNCEEYSLQTYVTDQMGAVQDNIRSLCHGESPDTSPYPYTEPHNSYRCEWQTFQECTQSIANMEASSDPDRMCPIYKEGKRCLDNFVWNCEDDDTYYQMRDPISQMIESVKTAIDAMCPDDTTDPDSGMCKWEDVNYCMEDMMEAYGMKEKCQEAGEARACLGSLRQYCDNAPNMEMRSKYRKMMGDVQNLMNNCMHGDGSLTGDDDVKWRPSFATSLRSSRMASLVAPVVALLVAMAAARL